MSRDEVRETLEKQLQLLSERSQNCPLEYDLAVLTDEMVKISEVLLSSQLLLVKPSGFLLLLMIFPNFKVRILIHRVDFCRGFSGQILLLHIKICDSLYFVFRKGHRFVHLFHPLSPPKFYHVGGEGARVKRKEVISVVMKIKELREAANLQQKQVAECMGVLQSAVSNWETEVALPKARQLPLLAQVLGCSIDDLFAPMEDVG